MVDEVTGFAKRDGEYLANVFREGRGGIEQLSHEELLDEHEDTFGERWEHDPRPEAPAP